LSTKPTKAQSTPFRTFNLRQYTKASNSSPSITFLCNSVKKAALFLSNYLENVLLLS